MKELRISSHLSRLQDWYYRECNEDWEHTFGIKIETLDNPGWMITIDLAETKWENWNLPLKKWERTDLDWYQYKIDQQQFIGCGGPFNLEEIIEAFFEVTTPPGFE